MTVQTACSSSLVAVHLTGHSLRLGEAGVAIAAGVNVEKPHRAGYHHEPDSIWSDDGHCRPFDRAANGTITASRAGAVVIKSLDRALTDGDTIHAVIRVIRGSAINDDGNGNGRVGFTASSARHQSLVVRAALAAAGVDRADVGYLETHGAATAVGDADEWAGVERVLGPQGPLHARRHQGQRPAVKYRV